MKIEKWNTVKRIYTIHNALTHFDITITVEVENNENPISEYGIQVKSDKITWTKKKKRKKFDIYHRGEMVFLLFIFFRFLLLFYCATALVFVTKLSYFCFSCAAYLLYITTYTIHIFIHIKREEKWQKKIVFFSFDTRIVYCICSLENCFNF